MAFPRTLSGVAFPGRNYYMGPFRSGAGNTYVVVRDSTATDELEVWKADNGDAVWAEQDSGSHPNMGSEISNIDVDDAGDDLHIVTTLANDDVRYHEFAMDTDTWTTVNETIDNVSNSDTNAASIRIRSDSDKAVIYQQSTESIKGTGYDRIDYAVHEGTAWTDQSGAVDDGGEINYRNHKMIHGASDKMHFFYRDDSNQDYYHKSFTSGNSLSSAEQVNDNTSSANRAAHGTGVYYDAAGTERITVVWHRSSDSHAYTSEIDADGVPGAEEDATDATALITDVTLVACLAVDSSTDTVYIVYSRASDSDMYFASNVNSGGWGSDTSILTSITCNKLSANLYDNDSGDTVLAILYDDAGTVKYTEHVVVSGGTEFTQPVSGALTFSGTALKKTLKPLSGALTFAGNIIKKILKPLAGALTFSGDVFKKVLKQASGALTFTGVVTAIKIQFQTNTGVLTFSGNVFKKSFEVLAGVLTFSGSEIKKTLKPLAGALTFSGNVLKKTLKPLSGVLAFAGTVAGIKKVFITLTGTLTFSGNVLKKTLKPLSGVLAFSGNVLKKTLKPLAGALIFFGNVTPIKKVFITLTGALTFAGTVITLPKKLLAGDLTFSGNVLKKTLAARAGTLAFSGNAFKKNFEVLVGVLIFSGDVFKKPLKPLSSALTFSGSEIKKTLKILAGALTFTGTLSAIKFQFITLTGTLAFSGDVLKKTLKPLTGALTFSSNAFKKSFEAVAGVLAFSGSIVKKTLKLLSGVLTFAGSVTTVFMPAGGNLFFQTNLGVLTFSGNIFKKILKSLSGAQTSSGAIQKKTLKIVVGTLNFVGAIDTVSDSLFLEGSHITTVSIMGEHDVSHLLMGEHDNTEEMEGSP